MSQKVNFYGASPNCAELLQSRTMGDQKLYLVKLIFPRGDATSLLIGFDAEGKIIGINLLTMAGGLTAESLWRGTGAPTRSAPARYFVWRSQ